MNKQVASILREIADAIENNYIIPVDLDIKNHVIEQMPEKKDGKIIIPKSRGKKNTLTLIYFADLAEVKINLNSDDED